MKIRTPYPAMGMTALASFALVGVMAVLPQDSPVPGPKPANLFSRTEDAGNYNLVYGWTDFKGNPLRVEFPMSKKTLSEAEEEYGYREEELDAHLEAWGEVRNAEMIAGLKKLLRGLIDESGTGEYIFIEEKGALEFTLKLSVPPDLQDKVKPVFDSVKGRLAEEYASATKKIQDGVVGERNRFFESRGLLAEGDAIRVDYRKSVRKNTSRVRHVLEALRAVGAKLNLRSFLGLSLSFIQDITYQVPPTKEGDRLILGFWAPPKVLVRNLGDCDSKGVAFASLWLNFKTYPVILIRVPGHMFVGLAIPSMESEGMVINGLRYTLCEVSPNLKIPPGLVTTYSSTYLKSGRYQYELVSK